ncbi:MAG: hypothetical protein ACYCZF_08290 [Anaerolineae bacterium]
MKRLNKLYFLIHGFCWACIEANNTTSQPNPHHQPYLVREYTCSRAWCARLADLTDTQVLVVVPFGPSPQANDFYAQARAVLGDRYILLDAPDPLVPGFWADQDADYALMLMSELGSAFVHQQYAWNKEELHTALHCRALCRQFEALLAQRGYEYDAATVAVEAWGASFDGCVTKYTLNLRRMLGLDQPVDINYALTVPDAPFLLGIMDAECVLLDNGLRLYLFASGDQTIVLYTATSQALSDQPVYVQLQVPADLLSVRSKQGIRLWPEPEEYHLPTAPPGCYEPPQQVVRYEDGCLYIPVNAGYVYRLAKAPAYLFFPQTMPYSQARSIALSAVLAPYSNA